MPKIHTKNNLEIQFDEEDFDLVSSYRWNICNSKGKKYARTTIYHPKKHDVYLHHLIMGKPKRGHAILFLDGDTLNLKRENLVQIPFFTKSHINEWHLTSKSSIYRGVYIRHGFYVSKITYDGLTNYLGQFKSEEEAAVVYDLKAIELYKEFAVTNIVQNPFIQNINPNPN
ncbi:hypothetical protein EMA8858_00003 [Emticicia aquatica]|uniref:AP2/ERF domain-containing protein n=1 Tax=Emticicia aquatica TaxID=1681835 RepID=A0ABN8EM73_9BACT|nr:hypothetical protein [Emticicia aquatica]CAH0993898.1 hypothetical protein EMA8858_00003 [Emticicia aquatica]